MRKGKRRRRHRLIHVQGYRFVPWLFILFGDGDHAEQGKGDNLAVQHCALYGNNSLMLQQQTEKVEVGRADGRDQRGRRRKGRAHPQNSSCIFSFGDYDRFARTAVPRSAE